MVGWLTGLFGKKQNAGSVYTLAKSRGWTFDIVGESNYQTHLQKIAGRKEEKAKRHYCLATLAADDGNKFDPLAVMVQINGKVVGYLSRDNARKYRKELSVLDASLPAAIVEAVIVGGWSGPESEGDFGVKLNLKWPLEFTT